MARLKVCAEPGCPELQPESKCAKHRPSNREERGYGTAHDRLRADYQRRMNAGEVFICWRCDQKGKPHPVDPTPSAWDLGHDDHDRSVYRGPECRAGNRATATR